MKSFLQCKRLRDHWTASQLVLVLLCPLTGTAQSPSPAAAIALEQQGKLEEAAQTWQTIIHENPNDAAAYASLGVVCAKQQKYSEAAAAYKKALALNPKLPGIQLNLGLAEFKQGNFAAAIAPLNAAAKQTGCPKRSSAAIAGNELLRRQTIWRSG